MQPSESSTLHGVFLNVFNTGVVITGKSGIGKSEIALSLIDRGHALIADDIIELTVQNDSIYGNCPLMLQDFLEVRGLGVLPIRKLFGDRAISDAKRLDLIVDIIDVPDQQDADRIVGQHSLVEFCGISVAKVGIPVNPGRHLCVLVETAVRLYQLTQTGYSPSQEFIQRSDNALSTNREIL